MTTNHHAGRPLALTTGFALLFLVAVGCGPVGTTEADPSVGSAAQAVGAAPAANAAAAKAGPPEAFSCKKDDDDELDKKARAVGAKRADDQYRAPSKAKPLPDPKAELAASATLMAAPVDPKNEEKRARYNDALTELRKKHPHQGEAFEKARTELKLRMLSDIASE